MKKPITGMTGQPATASRMFLAKKKYEIESRAAAIPAITQVRDYQSPKY